MTAGEERRKKAEEIKEKICDIVEGLCIVGSVAYNPKAVTEASDLDLVGVMNFSKENFEALYKVLNLPLEPLVVSHAVSGKINNVSIVWEEGFEIGLHLWGDAAFQNVVSLEGHSLIFRRRDHLEHFRSTADVELLKNTKGEVKEIYKHPEKIEGGHVLHFYPLAEGKYVGIQAVNLLLSPTILCEKNNFLSRGLETFHDSLKRKLSGDLFLALPNKVQKKITKEMKEQIQKTL